MTRQFTVVGSAGVFVDTLRREGDALLLHEVDDFYRHLAIRYERR